MKSIIYLLLVPVGVSCFNIRNTFVKESNPYLNNLKNDTNTSNNEVQANKSNNFNAVTYYLYTKLNPIKPFVIKDNDINQLANSRVFDPERRNIFLIHGWTCSFNSTINTLLKDAILPKNDFNVFVADWSPVSKTNYMKAARAVSRIGIFIGTFINEIIAHFHISGSEFTIIGHSLGAHVAGNAGSVTVVPIDQIIGLDPAGPLFNYVNSAKRLDAKHAQYVQVIHTNGLTLGYPSSIGHVDYYPNGGMVQAGCNVVGPKVCSHSRAYEFLAEAIKLGSKFMSVKCGDYIDFQDGKCEHNQKSLMGLIDPDKTIHGDFYLETNGVFPFAKG